MVSLGRIVQGYIPVDSLSHVRAERAEPVEKPAAGARWGKAAAFQFSAAETRSSGSSITSPDERSQPRRVMRVLRATADVQHAFAYVREGGSFIEVRRIESMRFQFNEPLPRKTPDGFQPRRYSTYELFFNLHPDDENKEGGGA